MALAVVAAAGCRTPFYELTPPCDPGFTRCDGVCVNPMHDDAHCGTCGRACTTGTICLVGSCLCPPPLRECAGRCLDTASDRSLWKDRALVELNRAVLHSFDRAGVTIADHHTESRRFLSHVEREEGKGREVGADWSWIVPPISGSATPVFHRTYEDRPSSTAYVHHPGAQERAQGRDLV